MEATCDPPILERWQSAPAPAATPPTRTDAQPGIDAATSHDGTSAVRVAAPTARAPETTRPSWTRSFLDSSGSLRDLAIKSATGLGLSALYGLALGARDGGTALFIHAIGVPAALVAVTVLGLPALYIVLALFDAPFSPRAAANSAASSIASAGLVLAGLAPLAALYVVSSASEGAATLAGAAGLAIGGVLGLRHLLRTLRDAISEADHATKFVALIAQAGFALFAIILATRVWAGLLPLVGGAS